MTALARDQFDAFIGPLRGRRPGQAAFADSHRRWLHAAANAEPIGGTPLLVKVDALLATAARQLADGADPRFEHDTLLVWDPRSTTMSHRMAVDDLDPGLELTAGQLLRIAAGEQVTFPGGGPRVYTDDPALLAAQLIALVAERPDWRGV